MRIDYFCEDPVDVNDGIFPAYHYLLNEVEGYESQIACHRFDDVQTRILNSWVQNINQLVKCHLRRINHPLSLFFDNSEEFDIIQFDPKLKH